jgi:Fe-S-cluster containining protein
MTKNLQPIVGSYRQLLTRVDGWFGHCLQLLPHDIRCGQGCSGCCRGLFDITLLDAWLMKEGFDLLRSSDRVVPMARAQARLVGLSLHWPEIAPPYILNVRPDAQWEQLMPEEDETPCPLLDANGRCLVYDHRPLTCRLHGLPLIDTHGEILDDVWCTENFTGKDPLSIAQLRGPFAELFREEGRLGRLFTAELLGNAPCELDTLIPTALLVDLAKFDWRGWWEQNGEAVGRGARLNEEQLPSP